MQRDGKKGMSQKANACALINMSGRSNLCIKLRVLRFISASEMLLDEAEKSQTEAKIPRVESSSCDFKLKARNVGSEASKWSSFYISRRV